MVVTNDDRVIAYGTMGGEGQPQTQAAVILRHLAGMPLTQAIAEPRWLIGRTWGDNTAKLRLEPRFDPSVVKALSERGHDVEVLSEAFSDTMGHAGAVSKAADGSVSGSSDPRCDGCFAAICGFSKKFSIKSCISRNQAIQCAPLRRKARRKYLRCAPVAQLDRVPGYEPGGRGFESYPAHHIARGSQLTSPFSFLVHIAYCFSRSLFLN